MENLNKKQKIILGIIGMIGIILIIIYVWTKDNSTIYSDYENIYEGKKVDNTMQSEINTCSNEIYIHIAGEVNKPGVIKIQENARIAEVIEKAEGLTDSADTKEVNLAYKVADGQKVYIPSVDEVLKAKEENKSNNYISNGSGVNIENADDRSLEEVKQNGKVNINMATQTELELLSGIGPSTAQKILEYRKTNGKFKSIEDIQNVSGIGEAKYNSIKSSITI